MQPFLDPPLKHHRICTFLDIRGAFRVIVPMGQTDSAASEENDKKFKTTSIQKSRFRKYKILSKKNVMLK